jgi:transcriptional regulator with XRE-family HTH domain
MKFEEYLAELEQDAEYQEAERELKPCLDLANEVLALRLERGWSQAELARRAGTRQANISRIETAQANPTLKVLHKLAQAFEADLRIELVHEPREHKFSSQSHLDVPTLRTQYEVPGRGYWQFGKPPSWQGPKQPPRQWLPDQNQVKFPINVEDFDDPEYTAA